MMMYGNESSGKCFRKFRRRAKEFCIPRLRTTEGFSKQFVRIQALCDVTLCRKGK